MPALDLERSGYDIRQSQRELDAEGDDLRELRAAAMEDMFKRGAAERFKGRFGSSSNIKGMAKSGSQAKISKEKAEKDASLVKTVMETSGGDNAQLARKIHERYDRAGLKQPTVDVRFEKLNASAMAPAGSSDGLFTVGVDLQVKMFKALGAITRQKPPMEHYTILHDLTGVFNPGRICLLLGPPGGGKSMLMKTLSGLAPAAISGDITYNGHTQQEFNVRRTARYVAQQDLHNPNLTVRETLTFSARCQGPGYNRSMLQALEKKEEQLGITPEPAIAELMSGMHHDDDPSCNVALTLQMLQLVNCADTVVGDGMTRGVSGGEKKRVTTGEIVVGPSKVLFMDEISTGLDSASTFTIVQSLANVAHATDSTIVVALLQPEPQVYDLFDDIFLLANGRTVYQGPRESVEPYFRTLGFEVTGKKAVADFLQELASEKDQPALRTAKRRFEPHLDFVPVPAFAAAFEKSDVFAATRRQLDAPFDKSKAHPAALMKSKYGVPGFEALKALMWREKLLLTADRQAQIYRYAQMAFLAFVLSTVFVRGRVTNDKDLAGAQSALSVMFFSLAYMQFLGLAECAETMQRLPVFYKQKFNLIFPGWAYAIPFAIIRIPITLIEVTFWSIVVYWVTGLETEPGRFFTFWAILISVQLMSSSLYRLIGSTVRAIVTGVSTAVVTMLVFFIGSGFVLLRHQIPDYWIWMFWVSPLQYAITGLANNEFSGKSYRDPGNIDPKYVPNGQLGTLVLENYQFNIGSKWRWLAVIVLLGFYVLFNLINIVALTFLPPPPLPPPAPPVQEEDYELKNNPASRRSLQMSSRRSLPGLSQKQLSHLKEASTAAAPNESASGAAQHAGAADGAHANGEVAVGMNGDPNAVDGDTGSIDGEAAKPQEADASLNLPFEPITLTFSDLHYFVPNPKGSGELELLKGIYGVFKPGILTALMGASGAGKTTLMDVLADRKTAGRMTGDVRVNGFEKDAASFARVMGYCEQFDTHSSGTTVAEAVEISALLRLSKNISKEQRDQFVEETLRIVELDKIRGAIVGIPGMFGLSGEQFKRLTIAVELVANPSIIFCDEPTSGLDARAAQIVMRVVRNIVNNNRTIVCTIHQPSAEIFLHFDELLLLKRGGSTIYYGPIGPESETLVNYFESASPEAKKLSRGYNPATYMLEATTTAEEERLQMDFGELWAQRQKADTIAAVDKYSSPVEGTKAISFESEYSRNRIEQYKALFLRYFKAYWRSPPYNTTRLILALTAAFILGSAYWSLGDKYGNTGDVTNVLGALFISVMFVGFINFQMIIPTFFMERPVMYRERAARMYAVLPWVQSMEDVEIPWILGQCMLFTLVVYLMIHFEYDAGKFFFFWINVSVSCATMAYTGMVMVCVTPNLQMGVTMGATCLGCWFLFAGFLITRPNLPPWWKWFSYLCPPAWSIYAIVVDQLGERTDPIDFFDGTEFRTNVPINQYLRDNFEYKHSMKWPAFVISLGFVIVLRFAVAIATKYLHFQKR